MNVVLVRMGSLNLVVGRGMECKGLGDNFEYLLTGVSTGVASSSGHLSSRGEASRTLALISGLRGNERRQSLASLGSTHRFSATLIQGSGLGTGERSLSLLG